MSLRDELQLLAGSNESVAVLQISAGYGVVYQRALEHMRSRARQGATSCSFTDITFPSVRIRTALASRFAADGLTIHLDAHELLVSWHPSDDGAPPATSTTEESKTLNNCG